MINYDPIERQRHILERVKAANQSLGSAVKAYGQIESETIRLRIPSAGSGSVLTEQEEMAVSQSSLEAHASELSALSGRIQAAVVEYRRKQSNATAVAAVLIVGVSSICGCSCLWMAGVLFS